MIEANMKKLAELDQALESARANLDATPEAELVRQLLEERAQVVDQLKDEAIDEPGVVETAFGKVGWPPRRTVVYPVEVVRDLVPTIAPNVIPLIPAVEKVDRAALERSVKAAIKAKTVAPNMLDRLLERAEVTVSNAWICSPTIPEPSQAVEADALPF